MPDNDRKNIFYLFLCGVMSIFPSLWVDQAGIMEARNFVTAREMVRSGNWIITTMNGEFRFEKPPLPTWLTAFCMKLFHTTSNEFILRLPVALCTLGLIFLVYFLVKSATGNSKLAFISGLVTSTTFMIIKLGNDNAWDMFPYIFMFACVIFIFRGFKNGKSGSFIISGIFFGASLLSKGPVPVYGMMTPFLISYAITYGYSDIKNNWKNLLMAVFIGLGLAALWPAAIMISHKQLFLSVMNKEADSWTTRHVKSMFYYFDYVAYTGVWLMFALASFYKKWSEKRSPDKKFFSMIFFWNLITFIFLSSIKMKKKRYGVPLYILTPMMLSHLVFYFMNKDWRELVKGEKFLMKTHLILMTVISLSIPAVFYLKGYKKGLVSAEYLWIIIAVFILFSYEFINGVLSKRQIRSTLFLTGLLMIVINISAVWFLERYVRNGYRNEYKFLSTLKNTGYITQPVFTFDDDEITNVWNVGKKIERIDDLQTLPDDFFILENSNEPEIEETLNSGFIIKSRDIYYKYEDEDDTINLYRINRVNKN